MHQYGGRRRLRGVDARQANSGGEINRRSVFAGAAALAVASVAGRRAERDGAVTIDRGSLTSRHWPGREAGWVLVRPPEYSTLVIALHSLGSNARLFSDTLDASGVARRTGLAIAAIDGGTAYWHPHSDGVDTAAMVLDDFIPMLAAMGLPTARIGLTGVSMGGFGALRLATVLPAERVVGVGVVAPAVRRTYNENHTLAFDSRSSFDANNPFHRIDRLRQVPICIACGRDDRFYAASVALAAELPDAVTIFDDGGHSTAYARRHWEPVMRWLAMTAGA
ncbi:MAG: hypothetical protein Q4G51_16345 [Dermatophilus congolensis]|nr:hypothetical protein [Dermatophilus congolensis]